MLLRLILLSFLAASLLSSCDPGSSVMITNKSKADKQIKVYCPASAVSSPCGCNSNRDSILTYPNEKDPNRSTFAIPTTKDTAERVYAFVLQAGHTAVIEPLHIGIPCYGKQFIIDNMDTVELKPNGRDFTKTPSWGLGSEWTYTIRNK
jgi:hypothetical protein